MRMNATLIAAALAAPGLQMALRIHLEQSGRPRADVPELRLIYKQRPTAHSAQGPRH